jgi:hypothetical protein
MTFAIDSEIEKDWNQCASCTPIFIVKTVFVRSVAPFRGEIKVRFDGRFGNVLDQGSKTSPKPSNIVGFGSETRVLGF